MWQPRLPKHAYKTFGIRQPLATHYRKATCAEVECEAFTNGWVIPLTGLPDDLHYTATHSGRKWQVIESPLDGQPALWFEPGQACFRSDEHRVSLEREANFLIGRGHYTIKKTDVRTLSADNWMDSLLNHMDELKGNDG